jgi:hypothetical protein
VLCLAHFIWGLRSLNSKYGVKAYVVSKTKINIGDNTYQIQAKNIRIIFDDDKGIRLRLSIGKVGGRIGHITIEEPARSVVVPLPWVCYQIVRTSMFTCWTTNELYEQDDIQY